MKDKIAEIREWAEYRKKHSEDARSILLLFAEIDRLQTERDSHAPDGRNYTNQQYVDLLTERDKLIEGLREIDTHIRSTPEPVQHIVETLKRVLPEYQEGVTLE